MAVGQGPWHSVNSDIYHNNPDCQTGGSIDPENIRPGTGGKRLCEECARLDNASGSVSAPMGDVAGEPGRGTREAATSQPTGAAYDPLAEPTVRRAGAPRGGVGAEEEARIEESVRRGARRAMDETAISWALCGRRWHRRTSLYGCDPTHHQREAKDKSRSPSKSVI